MTKRGSPSALQGSQIEAVRSRPAASKMEGMHYGQRLTCLDLAKLAVRPAAQGPRRLGAKELRIESTAQRLCYPMIFRNAISSQIEL